MLIGRHKTARSVDYWHADASMDESYGANLPGRGSRETGLLDYSSTGPQWGLKIDMPEIITR